MVFLIYTQSNKVELGLTSILTTANIKLDTVQPARRAHHGNDWGILHVLTGVVLGILTMIPSINGGLVSGVTAR
jgi:hypothetical protein